MTYTHILSRVLFCVFAVASLSQCKGGKSKSQAAEMTVYPAQPIVIDASVKIGDKTYNKPWFSFEVEIENLTGYRFRIVALEAIITATSSSGTTTTKTVAWAPGEADYTLDDLKCSYTIFGTWDLNEKKKLRLENSNNLCGQADALFFSDNNERGVNGNSFRYKVKVKPQGYFIDENGNPDDRFDKTKTIFTR